MEAIFFTISMSNLVAITVAEISKVPVYLSTVYLFDPVVNLGNATSNEPTRQLNYPIHALAYNMIHFMLFRKIGTVVRYSCRSLVYQRHYLVSIFSPRQQYLRYFSGAIFKLIVVALRTASIVLSVLTGTKNIIQELLPQFSALFLKHKGQFGLLLLWKDERLAVVAELSYSGLQFYEDKRLRRA